MFCVNPFIFVRIDVTTCLAYLRHLPVHSVLPAFLFVYFLIYDLVLLAKEEKVLQDMIDKLIEIGRCYGMEINVEKTKVMRISR